MSVTSPYIYRCECSGAALTSAPATIANYHSARNITQFYSFFEIYFKVQRDKNNVNKIPILVEESFFLFGNYLFYDMPELWMVWCCRLERRYPVLTPTISGPPATPTGKHTLFYPLCLPTLHPPSCPSSNRDYSNIFANSSYCNSDSS